MAHKTKRLRHSIVKLIAPIMYEASDPIRPMIRFLETRHTSQLIGVEIGVQHGLNAFNMLKTLPIKTLYLIDPYETYYDSAEGLLKDAEIYFELAKENLAQFNNKIKFIRKKSDDAVNDIPLVDFIYIDGNHELKYIKNDIVNYYPKVKHSGVIGGHDYPYFPGVYEAVNDFVAEKKLELHHRICDWWVIKP